MTTIYSAFRIALTMLCLSLLAACGGGDENSVPLSTAEEVKMAFDKLPVILGDYGYTMPDEASTADVQMRSIYDPLNKRWDAVVTFRGVILQKVHGNPNGDYTPGVSLMWGGSSYGIITIVTEYTPAQDWSGSSRVFLDDREIESLRYIRTNLGEGHDAAVREIREYHDGWFIVRATFQGDKGSIQRWVMYQPVTQELIDCGEYGSNREPSWGPSLSPACLRR